MKVILTGGIGFVGSEVLRLPAADLAVATVTYLSSHREDTLNQPSP